MKPFDGAATVTVGTGAGDLAGNVDPVHWSIRLLLPTGSLLLDVPEREESDLLHRGHLGEPWGEPVGLHELEEPRPRRPVEHLGERCELIRKVPFAGGDGPALPRCWRCLN